MFEICPNLPCCVPWAKDVELPQVYFGVVGRSKASKATKVTPGLEKWKLVQTESGFQLSKTCKKDVVQIPAGTSQVMGDPWHSPVSVHGEGWTHHWCALTNCRNFRQSLACPSKNTLRFPMLSSECQPRLVWRGLKCQLNEGKMSQNAATRLMSHCECFSR